MFLPNEVSEEGSILHDTPQTLLVQGVAVTTRGAKPFQERLFCQNKRRGKDLFLKKEGESTFLLKKGRARTFDKKEGARTFLRASKFPTATLFTIINFASLFEARKLHFPFPWCHEYWVVRKHTSDVTNLSEQLPPPRSLSPLLFFVFLLFFLPCGLSTP